MRPFQEPHSGRSGRSAPELVLAKATRRSLEGDTGSTMGPMVTGWAAKFYPPRSKTAGRALGGKPAMRGSGASADEDEHRGDIARGPSTGCQWDVEHHHASRESRNWRMRGRNHHTEEPSLPVLEDIITARKVMLGCWDRHGPVGWSPLTSDNGDAKTAATPLRTG